MSDDLRATLRSLYAVEHRDHVDGLRRELARLPGGMDFEEAYRHAHSLKGAARAIDLPEVEAVAHGLETLLQAAWDGVLRLEGHILAVAARAVDAMEDISAAALAGRPPPAPGAELEGMEKVLRDHGLEVAAPLAEERHYPGRPYAPAAGSQLIRVEADAADRLLGDGARLILQTGRQNRLVGEFFRLQRELAAIAHMEPGRGQAAWLEKALRRQQIFVNALDQAGWELSSLVASVLDDIHRLRLITADSVFAPLGPMVRELAASLSREVEVTLEGLEVRADRDVLLPLAEPVLHLLRNAVSHGIEPSEERRRRGKPAFGHLRLTISVDGGRLRVRVEDDGRGLDRDAIAQAACRRGVISAEDAQQWEEDKIFQLIFEPGISTAGRVDRVAGRGMGMAMAIVRRVLNRMQGFVEVESRPGGGTAFLLSAPVAVFAQRLLLLRAGGQVFAVPAAAVSRVTSIPHENVVLSEGRSYAMVDGDHVPLVPLAPLLGLGDAPLTVTSLCVSVLRLGKTRTGLVVDGMPDSRDLPVAALAPPLADDPLLAGSVVLEEGGVVLVLSPGGLASRLRLAAQAGLAPVPPPPPRPGSRILVVDDSVTTRTLEKTILETHGYQVVTAVDGRQALQELERGPFDAVISDVEMPVMDGLSLLAAIRQDSRRADLPFVLVTSRGAESDRERGMRLGADAYIVKGGFDQGTLLDTIRRLVL